MVRVWHSRQRLGSAPLEPRLHALPLASHVRKRQLVRPSLGHDDQIDPHGEKLGAQTKTFSAEPFHAISLNGISDLAGHDEPEPRRSKRMGLGGYEEGEVRCGNAPPQPLGTNKLGMPADPPAPRDATHYFL